MKLTIQQQRNIEREQARRKRTFYHAVKIKPVKRLTLLQIIKGAK